MTETEKIIQQLDLQPHPEGGWFRETYRSTGIIPKEALPSQYDGRRNYSTCIYFLLAAGHHSNFHKVRQDEAWHFYKGDPIELHLLLENGGYSRVLIGNDLEAGQVPQFVVTGGTWFAANVIQDGNYGLVGCTVAPGFDFADFELAGRDNLLKEFPKHEKLIRKFTRG